MFELENASQRSGMHRGTVDAPGETRSSHDWIEELRLRMVQIQAAYVDDPHGALEQAHELMAQVVAHQEQSGNDDDADELAGALARYRDFCGRLVAATSKPA